MATQTIDQTPQRVDFKVTQANSLVFDVPFYEGGTIVDGEVVGGTPINVTTYIFRMQVRHPKTGATVIDLESGSGIEMTGDNWKCRVTITDTDLNIECMKYPYDFEYERTDGYVRTPFGGFIEVGKQITQ